MPTVALVVFDHFNSMALAAQSVFEYANVKLGEPFYQTLSISEAGGPVRASSGLTILTEPIGDGVFDTVSSPARIRPAPGRRKACWNMCIAAPRQRGAPPRSARARLC